jgi:hypothetical protein
MKNCTSCKKVKKPEEFNFKNKAKNIRHSNCKNCSRLYVRSHYERNKKYYLLKAYRRNQKIRGDIRDFILNYLISHPCVDCGEKDPVVLEFDHMSGFDKVSEVSALYKNYDLKGVKEEIRKCEVRCANCHRRKTARENSWSKNFAPVT